MERQLFISREKKFYGARDKDGNEKIPFKFREMDEKDDFALFSCDNDKLIVNLCTGKSMSVNGYEIYSLGNSYTDTRRGYFIMRKFGNNRYGVLDADFNVLIPFEYERITPANKCGLHKIDKNGRHGFADADFRIVAPCEYVRTAEFDDRLTLVSRCVVEGDKVITRENFAELCRYGCIDYTGHETIPCVYDRLRLGSIIWAKRGNDFGLITDHNEEIIPFGKYLFLLHAIKAPDGFTYSPEYDTKVFNCNVFIAVDKNGKYGLIDAAENVLAPFKYRKIKQFSINHVTFETDNGECSGLLDMKGREVAVLKNADFSEEFIYGYSICRYNGKKWKYGYVNAEFKEIVPCKYDYSVEEIEKLTVYGDEHYRPLIKVSNGNKISLFNLEGKLIYAKCEEFQTEIDGTDFVINIRDKRRWGVYDYEGNCIKPCEDADPQTYNKVRESTGYKWRYNSGKDSLSDESGNVILSEYDYIKDYDLRDGYAIAKKNNDDHPYVYDLRAKAVIPRKNCIDLEKTFMTEEWKENVESANASDTQLPDYARIEIIDGEAIFYASNSKEFEALLRQYPDYDEELIYPVYIPKNVKEIADGAFMSCDKLSDVVIEEGVKSIGDGAFMSCSELVTVELPSTLKKIGAKAFNGCVYLESVFIPKSVKSVGLCAFDFCFDLAEIEVEEGNPTYRSGFNAIIDKDNTVVATCNNSVLPDDLHDIGVEFAVRSNGIRMNYRFCEEGDEELKFLLSCDESEEAFARRIQTMVLRDLIAGRDYLLEKRAAYMWNVKPEDCTKTSLEGYHPKYSKMFEGLKQEGKVVISDMLRHTSELRDDIYAHTEEYAVVVHCGFGDILQNNVLRDKGNFVPQELRFYATSKPVQFLGGYNYITKVTYRGKEVNFEPELSRTGAAEVFVYRRIKGADKFETLKTIDVNFEYDEYGDLGEYLMINGNYERCL